MIKAIRSNNKSFKEISFEPGFNVVLAERTKGSSDKDSRNGLGKTTLIEIIHFCLGANIRKGHGLLIKELEGYDFTIDLLIKGGIFSITRKIDDPGLVLIKGDFSNWKIKPEIDKTYNVPTFSVESLRLLLGNLFFGLPENKSESTYSPSFRSLIQYFIRHSSGAFLDPFKFFSKQPAWSSQVSNNFLLGLNWEYSANFQKIKDRQTILKNLKNATNEGFIDKVLGTFGKLQAERVRLTESLSNMELQLKSFNVHPEYEKVQGDADSVTQKIHDILNLININEKILIQYKRSSESENDVVSSEIKNLYQEAGLLFSERITKDIQTVEQFHLGIIKNRKDYLTSEIKRLEAKIGESRLTIKELSAQRAEFMKILETHGALSEYSLLQGRKLEVKQKLESVKASIENLTKLQEGRSSLKIDKEELVQKASTDLIERSTFLDKAISLFNKNSENLYAEPGTLSVDVNDTGFKYEVKIERAKSQGVVNMKVFCYDMVLIQLLSEKNKDAFLVHDSTIFDGVDERQVAKAFELAYSDSKVRGFQYICTLNSDRIPLNDFTNDFKGKFNSGIRLTLSDATDEGGLLGKRF